MRIDPSSSIYTLAYSEPVSTVVVTTDLNSPFSVYVTSLSPFYIVSTGVSVNDVPYATLLVDVLDAI